MFAQTKMNGSETSPDIQLFDRAAKDKGAKHDKPPFPGDIGRRYFDDDPIDAVQLRPSNPCRSPAWRWHLARHLVESDLAALRRYADGTTLKLARLQSALRHCRTHDQYHELTTCRTPHPEMLAASEIRFGDDESRHHIETRVLADEQRADIARKVGCSEGTVEQYELLFFEVRPKLCQPTIVMFVVIGRPKNGEDETLLTVKQLAYGSRDPAVADRLLFGKRSGDAVVDQRVDDFLRRTWRVELLVKAAMAMRMPTSAIDDVKLLLRLNEQSRRRANSPQPPDVEQNLQAFFSGIEQSYGPPSPELQQLYESVEERTREGHDAPARSGDDLS